ncbi:MAG: hypothetical protein SGJ19_28925 [Planctomycetia bacterium]|nr:hypothetical protein [Planctomycetia bacterium]
MPDAVSATTILRYLSGDRQAIQSLIECPRALWLGLIFVISAGFAREYDAESLLHEPWYLLIPVAASLLTSFLLYALLYGAALSKNVSIRPVAIPSSPDNDVIATLADRPPLRRFWGLYPTFLTLYWMTAPLAWLYAIPVERFLSPYDAAVTNYWFLAFVSVWRVLLISRAASIMFSAPFGLVLCLVLLFADTVVLVASFTIPQPVFQVMGGVHHNALEQLNAGISGMSCCFSVLLWPVLFAIATSCFSAQGDAWTMPRKRGQPRNVHRSAWMLSACSIVAWAGILPFTQREQFLRYEVERELIYGNLRHGLAMMSERQRVDFPPGWSPPPYWEKRNYEPDFGDVLTAISTEPVAGWVKDVYWSIAEERFADASFQWYPGDGHEGDFRAHSVYLDLHPERDRVIREAAPDMRRYIKWASDSTVDQIAIAEKFKRLLQSLPGEDLLKEPSPEQHD